MRYSFRIKLQQMISMIRGVLSAQSKQTFTCSKSTIETPEKGVRNVQS